MCSILVFVVTVLKIQESYCVGDLDTQFRIIEVADDVILI